MEIKQAKEIIKKDPRIQQMILRKNLSPSRINMNYFVFATLYTLFGLTPSELINEALDEQKPKLVNGEIIFKEINDRQVTKHLYEYYSYLKKKGNKLRTIETNISIVRTFYSEYDVDLPKNMVINYTKPIVREGDLPTKEDILKAINSTNNKRNKAIIYFMSSTGMRMGDIISLTVQDLIKACEDYDVYTVDDLLTISPTHIVPCFYFHPQKTKRSNNICCTFCTPETFNAIQDYLKTRTIKSADEPLFMSHYGKFVNRTIIVKLFQNINDTEFGKIVNGKRFFKAHNLRKWFISTCNQHSHDLLKVHILSGHSLNKIDSTYNEINTKVMRRFYTSLIPYLTLNKTEVKTVKSKEYLDLEKKLEEQKRENQKLREDISEEVARQVNEIFKKYGFTQ